MKELPDNSVDLSVYSPPFSSLYIYSDSERDMGNCADDTEFFRQYSFAIEQLYRVTRPGRISAIHVKDLVYYQNQRGTAGLRDFTGGCIAAHVAAGFDFHCRITIWRDPVREMQKTKAHGLLYRQLRSDSTISRVGMPEYLCVFRKWAPDAPEIVPVEHTKSEFPLEQWQEWASPVWMTTRETNVLNAERKDRAAKDEKHIAPMPLDITERAIRMWSNPNEVVLSPFMGIGSEGVVALRCGRRFVGIELKDTYYDQARQFLDREERETAYGRLL